MSSTLYLERASAVHRLNPVTKLVALLCVIVVVFAIPQWWASVAVLLRHAVRYYETTEFFGEEADAIVPVTPAMQLVMMGEASPEARAAAEAAVAEEESKDGP